MDPEGYNFGGDDEFVFDFSGVESKFPHVPPANYLMQVKDIENGVTGNGKDKLTWKLMISEGQYEGVTLNYDITKETSTMWKMAEIVSALGLGVPGQAVRFKRGDAMGRMLMATIEDHHWTNRDGEDQVSSQVKKVRPAGK